MKWVAKKRLQSVIAISVVHGQLRVAHAARAKNAVAVLHAAGATLTLDLQHPEPELVGQEIKNHLDTCGIRERHCVVALPADWVMTQHTRVPELSPEDTASLLLIEAEKGFPSNPDELQIARSAHRSGEAPYVTQLAVRHEQLNRLGEVLKAAGLKAVSYTIGITALPGALPTTGAGRMTLLLEPKGATLLVAAGGGIVTLRTLEATIDSEVGENVINGPALARELRISFEQLPADLRAEVRELALRGEPSMVAQLAGILGAWTRDAGLSLDHGAAAPRPAAEEIVEQLAQRHLLEAKRDLEFL
ncbi:MAG: hypothetical protein WCQ89_10190, partial [Verrucomicrobiota bacterium]